VQCEDFDTTTTFFASIPPCFQDHVEEAEAVVHQERTMNIEQEVAESTIRWIWILGRLGLGRQSIGRQWSFIGI
jgi:hypothetical protein